MNEGTPPSIWAALEEAAATLPEPFSMAALLRWVEKRRPDVETSSISTHIHYAVVDTKNRDSHPLGRREPFLERVDRGLYRSLRGGEAAPRTGVALAPVARPAAETPSSDALRPVPSESSPVVVLVGCSSRKASTALPARDLFRGDNFERARDRAIGMGVPWFVLSAKFGLLHPDDVVGHANARDWLGRRLDPAAFDPIEVTWRLRSGR